MIRKLLSAGVIALLALASFGCAPEEEEVAKDDKTDESTEVAPTGPILLDDFQPSGLPIKLAPDDGDEVAIMTTDMGVIVLMFHPEVAPDHVANFKNLSRIGFYDGVRFHRVMPGFMIQGGDPNSKDLNLPASWGMGDHVNEDGRRVMVAGEFSAVKHERGILSMARGDLPNSASCQFFIMHADYPMLDDPYNHYSVFGRVVSGMEVVDEIVMTPTSDGQKAFPEQAVVIESIEIVVWPIEDSD